MADKGGGVGGGAALAVSNPAEIRNVVLVGLPWQGRTVHLLLTHLTRRDDAQRQAQLRAVIDLFLSLAEPAVLLGDLNTEADDPQLARLLAAPGVEDAVGEHLRRSRPGDDPPRRIDWIISSSC